MDMKDCRFRIHNQKQHWYRNFYCKLNKIYALLAIIKVVTKRVMGDPPKDIRQNMNANLIKNMSRDQDVKVFNKLFAIEQR